MVRAYAVLPLVASRRRFAAARYPLLACALLGALLLACTDTGVVGAACKDGCDATQRCDSTLARCVECVNDADCSARDTAAGPYCAPERHRCVQCRHSDECSNGDECIAGMCERARDVSAAGANGDDNEHGPNRGPGNGGQR